MTYKSIHAPASGSDDDDQVFKSAAELAALHGARLTVVSAFMTPAVQLAYVVPPNLYLDPALLNELQQGHDEMKAKVRAGAEQAAQHAGLTFGKEVIVVDYDCTAWESAALWLPLSDLAVVGQALTKVDLTANLLLHGHAPVFVARPGLQLKPMTAAIAWDGSLCAGRAVRAALPLLSGAERIILLQQAQDIPADRRAAADPARISAYLALHGLEVEVESVPGHGDGGEAIVEALRGCSADVLVCGAYGHSRMAETILGGVTRSVLAAAFPSAFLAH